MRLGVSAKIFLAYAVLLVAFAASSLFTLLYLNRGRQEINANQWRLDVQVAVDRAGHWLKEFAQSRDDGNPRLGSQRVAQQGISFTRDQLRAGIAAAEMALAADAGRRTREEFGQYRDDLRALEDRLTSVAASLGAPKGKSEQADRDLLRLISSFTKQSDEIRNRGDRVRAELSANEQRATKAALGLGGVGVLAAILAGVFMLRTLRPLHVLRQHARQIAGGDYARRTQVRSQDEIGDLAREFDAMAHAIEERERRLIRSERLATVGRMAAQITHEIRNPLASIGLYVELLGDELRRADDEPRRLAAAIGNEVDRLSEITETYLRFVRLPRPKLEREDLGGIVTAVLEFARAELSLGGIALELSVEAGLPDVAADENQIRQALLNLVRNAREAMPSGGRLRVELGANADGHVRLAIADTGPGIAPEHLAKVFDPFFSTKDKGTGLGLALVQQIVSEHGGRIDVHSPAGGGTTFVLTFPALPAGAEGRSVSSRAAPPEDESDPPALAKIH